MPRHKIVKGAQQGDSQWFKKGFLLDKSKETPGKFGSLDVVDAPATDTTPLLSKETKRERTPPTSLPFDALDIKDPAPPIFTPLASNALSPGAAPDFASLPAIKVEIPTIKTEADYNNKSLASLKITKVAPKSTKSAISTELEKNVGPFMCAALRIAMQDISQAVKAKQIATLLGLMTQVEEMLFTKKAAFKSYSESRLLLDDVNEYIAKLSVFTTINDHGHVHLPVTKGERRELLDLIHSICDKTSNLVIAMGDAPLQNGVRA